MDQQSIIYSSDCGENEYEDFNLLTIVNEHSEVIRLIEDDRDTNLPIPSDNEIQVFHHPPDIPESDSDENNSCGDEGVEGNEDDSEEDEEHYIVNQE